MFDDELADARNLARLPDERGAYNDTWGSGIMRQAILAAGRRLVQDGILTDPENLIETDIFEAQSLLRGSLVVSFLNAQDTPMIGNETRLLQSVGWDQLKRFLAEFRSTFQSPRVCWKGSGRYCDDTRYVI